MNKNVFKIGDLEFKTINLKDDEYDPRDYKTEDFIFRSSATDELLLNKKYYITPKRAPIYNQGQTGMCGGFTLSSAMATMNYIERGKYERYSPGLIYAMREKDDWQGEGITPREIMKMAKQYGTCSNDDFPYLGSYDELKAKLDKRMDFLLPKAKENAIGSYYNIKKDDELNIKRSIVENGVVIVAWYVYSSVSKIGDDGIIPMVDLENEKFYGGHFSYLVGWETIDGILYWILANSWGTEVGDKGHYYMKHEYNAIATIYGVTDKPFISNNISVMLRADDNSMYIRKGEEWETIEMDTKPIIDENDRMLLPIRWVCEQFGLQVDWNGNAKLVTVSNYDIKE